MLKICINAIYICHKILLKFHSDISNSVEDMNSQTGLSEWTETSQNSQTRFPSVRPPRGVIYPNLYQFYGYYINLQALLYSKMVLFVNIDNFVFE